MKIKTSELIDQTLDWAVAKCVGNLKNIRISYGDISYQPFAEPHIREYWRPSENWSQGGPIIEREGIATDCLRTCGQIDGWIAATEQLMEDTEDEYSAPVEFHGPTPLIAAMRVYVALKLGDEVEIPEELK